MACNLTRIFCKFDTLISNLVLLNEYNRVDKAGIFLVVNSEVYNTLCLFLVISLAKKEIGDKIHAIEDRETHN